MELLESLKDRFLDRLSPGLMRSALLWQSAEGLVRSPLNRPGWKADNVSLLYFLRYSRLAFQQKKPVIWASLLFPSELIHAGGLIPFYPEMAAAVISRLGLASRFLEKAAEEGLSSDACSFHRVIWGSYSEGFMPEPQLIATVNYLCDSAPLSFLRVSVLDNIPCRILEVPFEENEESIINLASQIEELAILLAKLSGKRWEDYLKDLRETLVLSNRAREHLLEVENMRRNFPYLLDGKDALGHLSVLASMFGHPSAIEFYKKLAKEMKERANEGGCTLSQGKPYRHILWMHLKPYYSDSIFTYLKEHGARVVCEEYNRCYWEEMDPSRPFISLAQKLASHFGIGPSEKRTNNILRLVKDHRIDGAIHFNHWGCRQSTGSTLQIKQALKEEGIPFLSLEGECIDEREYQEGQIRTRLEAFLESL